jgi:3',5'-cyclic AMP phosphodiesterase CpdA
MAVFRILHASDLHFARLAHLVGIPDLLQAWLQNYSAPQGIWSPVSSQGDIYVSAFAAFVEANRQGLDAIVISGDLATTGDPADVRAAHRYLYSPAVHGYLNGRGKPTLQAADKKHQKPLLCLPGNHDRFRSYHLPGSRNFDHYFGAAWHARQGAQILYDLTRDGQTLILIGVDFSLRKSDLDGAVLGLPFGYLGRGRAYKQRIRQLTALTRKAKKQHPHSAILWVMHFEPNAADQSLTLLDEPLLAQAAQKEPVDALLCGHTHAANSKKKFAKIPLFVCGTTTQHASRHGNHFRVLEIDLVQGKAQFQGTDFFYNAALGRFV